ncbi:poly(R)-hydroxyalkanoic acid synthase subunit PhaE [Nitrincola sp. A-D6]|uniref:poly(R)-hydroxyalkanoic acid synthase subunit PhaE n=1 Tax=Nitrincola sp. A-D6 TaxID=1545442 RepID=UPI0013636CB2|nr:poly(R)-hydroxyalkanoic acid synthase subunit PhaE [Nitrincola sp. A-D6]
MTDDLQATIRRWLELYPNQQADTELPDWTELMQQLQQTGWQHLPEQHAELLAVMTQESVEFTRFAGQLLTQCHKEDAPELAGFFTDFHQHINRLTEDWVIKRWHLPEQLGALLRTHSFNDEQFIDHPWMKGMRSLMEGAPAELPFNQQKALRESGQLLNQHQQALQQYSAHYAQINSRALNRLSEQIETGNGTISSLTALHRLWVEAYEASYAEQLATEEYQLAHGRVSNTLMQLRLWFQEQRNQQLKLFGIATEASLNLAFEKIHQLSKQLRHLQRAQVDSSELRDELRQLKDDINTLQRERQ